MASKRYFLGLLCGGLLIALPWLLYATYLREIGEVDLHYVIKRQIKNDAIYMSGLNQDFYSYKRLLYQLAPHEVVVLGSSRSMMLSQHLVTGELLNMGGAVNSIAHLEKITDTVLASPQLPQLVLLFTDMWWFNKNYENIPFDNEADTSPVMANFVSMPLVIGRLENYNGFKKSLTFPNRLGLDGKLLAKGFNRNGTLVRYIRPPNITISTPDMHFQNTLYRIEKAYSRFEQQPQITDTAADRFAAVAKRYTQQGIKLVVLMPPFPKEVYAAMQKGGYGYIEDMKQKLARRGIIIEDYSDISRLPGGTSCEFMDGLHAGELIYARMLLQIASSHPDLQRWLKPNTLRAYITHYSGQLMPAARAYFPETTIEGDFLGLGCRRQ